MLLSGFIKHPGIDEHGSEQGLVIRNTGTLGVNLMLLVKNNVDVLQQKMWTSFKLKASLIQKK